VSRKIAVGCPPTPAISNHHPGQLASTYSIRVITPVFGGGASPAENDAVTPVRPSSVRGHLRFWWRATRGATFTAAQDLRKREGEIWGTVDKPSSVDVEVRVTSSGKPVPWKQISPPRSHLDYVLFPLREPRREGGQGPPRDTTLLSGVEFELTLRYPAADPELPRDLGAAVWAWVNFGGIGARTRRGCGALHCQALAPPAVNAIQQWFAAKRREYRLTEKRPPDLPWPVLFYSPRLSGSELSPTAAWDNAVSTMWEFRQGNDVGRDPGTKTPGRSRWPEADSIRALLGRGNPAHMTSTTLPDPKNKPAFPRAAFGLPIIFHLRDEPVPKVEARPVEPGQPKSTRMASPMILRALAIGDGDKTLPMILPLLARVPTELRLVMHEERKGETPLPRRISAGEISRPDLTDYGPHKGPSPMQGRSASGSPLEAFLSFAGKKGFKP